MKEIKVYVAGKINPNSVFGTSHWRDGFCKELSEKSGIKIINLDPTKKEPDLNLDESDKKLIFGRNSFLIKSADLVIVNLTDDISVGGSQEMLIAKYFKKPLLAIARRGGKFNKEEKEIFGKTYKNWKDPFVTIPSDAIVENVDEAARFIKNDYEKIKADPKEISIINEAIDYYEINRRN